MAGNDKHNRNGILTPKVTVADKVNSQYNSKTIQLRSIFDAHLKITGPVTGKLYEWFRAGSIVSVDESDAPELLTKRIGGNSCCGGNNQNGNQIFEVVN